MKHSNRIESNHSCIFFFMWSSSSLDRLFFSFSLTLHRRFFRTFILVAYYVPLVKFISYAFLTTSWSSRLNHRIWLECYARFGVKAACVLLCYSIRSLCVFFKNAFDVVFYSSSFASLLCLVQLFSFFIPSFFLCLFVCAISSNFKHSTQQRLLRSPRWYTITVL